MFSQLVDSGLHIYWFFGTMLMFMWGINYVDEKPTKRRYTYAAALVIVWPVLLALFILFAVLIIIDLGIIELTNWKRRNLLEFSADTWPRLRLRLSR